MRHLTKNDDLVIFYNSGKQLDMLILAYIRTHVDRLREIDISLTNLTNERVTQLATALDSPLGELIDRQSTYYPNYEGHLAKADDFAIMQMLCHNKGLLATPIVVGPEHASVPKGISDVIALLAKHPLAAVVA